MSNYQVLARKYRPQTFREVLGQDAIVTTLKNAIKNKRLAHAYLFCGSRGTGKTTLARVFAKALNCLSPLEDGEPCNACSSCKEISSGHSLDVLEIDGASHRGIDDIRQINETVGYASSSGKYKIYIIDEVHMLTKEAFNALLKTLEEPPLKVIFFFATTEPHKVLPTILSRCQRFNLNRIPHEKITEKLSRIAKEMNVDVESEALHLLAKRADGGLRDAESLFDQIIAFHEGPITARIVSDVLGVMPKEVLFDLDHAGKEGRLSMAFEIAHQIFSQGKDFIHFVESLTDHFRTIILIKLSGLNAPFLTLSEEDKIHYGTSAKLYTQEQCITILDFLIEAQNQIRFQPSGRIALECILLRIMRTHQRLPVEFLVRRLSELEQLVNAPSLASSAASLPPPQSQQPLNQRTMPSLSFQPKPFAPPATSSISIDPTPSQEDLGIRNKPKEKVNTLSPPPQPLPLPPATPAPAADMFSINQAPSPQPPSTQGLPLNKQSRYDTLLQFTAIELEGTVQKKQTNAP